MGLERQVCVRGVSLEIATWRAESMFALEIIKE